MSFWSSLVSRFFASRKDITVVSGLKLEMRPKSFSLLRVNSPLLQAFDFEFIKTDETCLDFEIWDKVKQEVLGGAFENNPGCLVTYSHSDIEEQDSMCASSMLVQYSSIHKSTMFLVLKDEWSRAELDDIAIGRPFGMNELWMLPNMDKVMSLTEFEEFCNKMHHSNTVEIDSDLKWETICICNEEEIRWINPSKGRAYLVVANLKKFCSEREIDFQEM